MVDENIEEDSIFHSYPLDSIDELDFIIDVTKKNSFCVPNTCS